ncbi:MAG: penicillin-binding protein activator [Methylococcales bacterium]|nr:penicillin-binding protein activator [Methylococcales bacterium]
MNSHIVILLTFFLLFLAGCATDPAKRHLYLSEAIQAESFMDEGQPKQAAALYQELAQSQPAHRDEFNLLAAEAFIQSGDSLSAKSLADLIKTDSLSAEQRNRLNLLHAQINLSNGDAEQAINILNITQPYNLTLTDQIIFYQSLAFAHSLTGDTLQSVQARIQLSPLFENSQQRELNNTVILKSLNLLPTEILLTQQPPAPDTLGGWMALTRLLKDSQLKQNKEQFQTNLAEWELLFPDHPAIDSEFLESYLDHSTHSFQLPSAIAILLPESGRFATAAQVIREGFMEAYHAQFEYQPIINFYDTSIENSVELYHQAISNGAELIIGPLSKTNIQNLALDTELTIPVLALNHIENLAKNNLFQFGLSPIDDVRQIVNKASHDGNHKALVLTPNNNQGQRINNHLTDYWQETGGTLLESQPYNSKKNDFSAPIKDLLNLDESNYRYKQLRRLLATNIEYTERRRHDVDAIFLSAQPQTARSIYPQLRFYRATNLPIYATSQLYNGQPNPSQDIDLNSITFCDIPWAFPETYPGKLSQQALRSNWQKFPRKYKKLLALGVDSFNVLTHLSTLDNIPYPGATGTLLLNQENRITRQLVCAKFINGKAVLQNPIIEQFKIISDQNSIYSKDYF